MKLSCVRIQLLSAVVLGALAISACGGSSSRATSAGAGTVTVVHTVTSPTAATGTDTATGPAKAPTGTATTPTTAAGTTSAAGSSPASGIPACTASTLTPVQLGSNGAVGTIVYSFALRNSGSRACHTYGFPGVSFLSSSGATLPTDVKRTTRDVVGSVNPTRIELAPGAEASFRITIEDAYRGGLLCRTARYLQIYAPDDTASMRLTLTSGGAQACGWGRVTSLQPGRAAIAQQ